MRRVALLFFGAVVLAVMALPAVAQRGGARRQVELPTGPARRVILKSCTVCHGLDIYATKALDRAGWQAQVDAMKAKGAVITDADASVLLDYLTSNFGPGSLPPQRGQTAAAPAPPLDPAIAAKGLELLNTACRTCHTLQRIESQSNTEDAWSGIVSNMRNRGARVSDEDAPALIQYLGRTYGPK